MDPSDPIEIAVRAYTEPKRKARRQNPRQNEASPWRPRAVLFLDCETTTDHTQRLNFGFYRYCRIVWTGDVPTLICVEEGIFYADDLPKRDPEGFVVLKRYAATHPADVGTNGVPAELRFRSQDEFLYHVFYMAGYRERAVVCGFNLPFDLSRLARHAGEARASRRRGEGDDAASATYRRGFSFSYWGRVKEGAWHDRPAMPRIAIKSLDSKRALIGFVPPKGAPRNERAFRGHFLDLRTLTFALTGESHSLESACTTFGVQHGKAKAEGHGEISRGYVRYARRDVLATSELFTATISEYLRHPITLPPTRAFSPASIGKAYMRALGVSPVLERQPDFPKEILGIAMAAYYGGWTECRVRKEVVPVRYYDFRSMYPTVCALMGIWQLLTAERIDVEDATASVTRILARVRRERVFDASFWKGLVGFVQIAPDGDVVPVRARYAGDGRNWQIGVNPLVARVPHWVTIADAVASVLLTRRSPEVLRAIRLVPHGRISSLRPVMLGGKVQIDPRRSDFFRAVIEERVRVQQDATLDEAERGRLEHFLKILANATSYGIFAELNRQTLPVRAKRRVRVYGASGTFETDTSAPEELGDYFFSPIAAAITGAARLMLRLLEREVADAGGTHAFCDTDSLAIVSTPAAGDRKGIRCLAWRDVQRIAERFRRLSPYDRTLVADLLKLEPENFDASGNAREIRCLAISAKRYALLARDHRGVEIVKHSEHGLGHLLNPVDPADARRDWMRDLWLSLVQTELSLPAGTPVWFRRPAVGQVTISSPTLWRPFAGRNRGRSYAESVKPFNFILAAHVLPFGHPSGVDPEQFQLIAPYERDPSRWLDLPWIDRCSGRRYAVTTEGSTGGVGVARVKRYGEVAAAYAVHPEDKSLGPDGSICRPDTRGLLLRRPVVARGRALHIGKESNELDEATAQLLHSSTEVLSAYDDQQWDASVLRDMPTAELVKGTGVDRSTAKRWKAGELTPKGRRRDRLIEFLRQRERARIGGDAPAKRTPLSPALRDPRKRARADGT